jgi:GDP-L-fucose synthase
VARQATHRARRVQDVKPHDRIYVAGHGGLVGSAILRRLAVGGFTNVVARSRAQLDLRRQDAVEGFFREQRPDLVFLAAARVGGIADNQAHPADFARDNLMIQTNVIDAAHRHGARRLLFLGSSCIYPRDAPQPIREEHLLTGPLEITNQAYAVAKIAGLEMIRAYRRQHGWSCVSVMPSNVYGPGDRFAEEGSHVVAALMSRLHAAKVSGEAEAVVWGSGMVRREMLHVDDLADACVLVMRDYDGDLPVNIGVGDDLSIRDLAALIRSVVGFDGNLRFDASRPDGTPRKLLDVSRIRTLGWAARIPLRRGLEETYAWFVRHRVHGAK